MKQPDINSVTALAVMMTLSAQKTMNMTPADISRRNLRLQAIERMAFDQETLALALKSVKDLIWFSEHLNDTGVDCPGYPFGQQDILDRAAIVLTRV